MSYSKSEEKRLSGEFCDLIPFNFEFPLLDYSSKKIHGFGSFCVNLLDEGDDISFAYKDRKWDGLPGDLTLNTYYFAECAEDREKSPISLASYNSLSIYILLYS